MFYRNILWSLRALLGLALLGSKELPRGKGCVLGGEKFHGRRQWSVTFIDLPGRICCWHLLSEEKTSDRVRGLFLILKNINLLPEDKRRNTYLVTCSCSQLYLG